MPPNPAPVSLTSVNIALPQMQKELNIAAGNLQWLVSAYTLAFGGFLLLAGVVADRFGKRLTFCSGMVWLTIWSLAVSFAQDEISAIVFRALQGLGAAATVPSAIGVICTYFAGKEQNRAMSCYGAAGAVGFVAGLILGGLLTASLGWRWIFRVTTPLTAALAVVAWFCFPLERKRPTDAQPSMDIAGACLGTLSMVLLTLGLSSSEAHGWGKAIAIAPIVIAVVVLGGFLLTERKVKNPVMPLWLWRQPSFAAIWFAAFFMQAWWGSLVYYVVLIAQGPLHLSPLQTAVRLAPCGVQGFIITLTCGPLLQRFTTKQIIVTGLGLSILANIPSALVKPYQSFWGSTFLSMMIAVTGVSWAYNVLAISLVASVPAGIKSMSGGLINTAFQIGTAVGLSLCGVVAGSISGHDKQDDDDWEKMRAYSAALWMSTGLIGLSTIIALFGIKGGHKVGAQAPVH
ncbi:hypothetical protein NliqN6_0806 [Naganishia liquefaciens]|uniref:Major facilitator superfamily (MFS) profile domain-containing protein n=1 Tax=Naganishia liquefaciens TaxID=104408 RepID=A0A8H3TP31_9TREE|nr:hypothetical protein NliqN6_0806 [Naganishia liquefaciens]